VSTTVLWDVLMFAAGVYVGFTVGWLVFARDQDDDWRGFSEWEIEELKRARDQAEGESA
jgi:hypothetical protein